MSRPSIPAARRIVLQYYLSFADAAPVDLYQRIVELVGQARRWRQGGQAAERDGNPLPLSGLVWA